MIKKCCFKLKKVSVSALALIMALLIFAPGAFAAGRQLIPMGCTVGIVLDTDGVIVAGYSQGTDSPAKAAGILPGDIITKIGDKTITCAEDIRDCKLDGSALKITVMRGDAVKECTVTPSIRPDGTSELGLWLRDSLSGIGTVTYYDPETGEFGALGHPVNDVDTGIMIPMRAGQITQATITDIIQGKCGTPGQLVGIFDLNSVYGEIEGNTPGGIFGKITDSSIAESSAALEIADAVEIHTGKAAIISSVDNAFPKEYSVEITRVDSGSRDGRCMMLKVTDEELLSATGGIVQGMGLRYNRDNTGNP